MPWPNPWGLLGEGSKTALRWFAAILILLALAVAWAIDHFQESAGRFVEKEQLSGAARSAGEADRRLGQGILDRMGLQTAPDREIDLDAPSEGDIQFLLETLRGADPSARRSAARVLGEIQEIRAVGPLVRLEGTPADKDLYCSLAVEILRFRSREEALGLMIDVLENNQSPPAALCRDILQSRLNLLLPNPAEAAESLLADPNPRIQRFALRHLGSKVSRESRATIKALTASPDRKVQDLARSWIARPSSGVAPPPDPGQLFDETDVPPPDPVPSP